VTTADGSLLEGVRAVLADAEEARLCVAFASPAGVHLVGKELTRLRGRARVLVTTQFGTTTVGALGRAKDLGADVRVLNPAGSRTYHPKLYLGRTRNRIAAVIGSANLTGGLVSNIEVAVHLEGTPRDAALAEAWSRADAWWNDRLAQPWLPGAVAEPAPAADWGNDPALFDLVRREVAEDPIFETLGTDQKRNRVTELTPDGAHVETARSRGTGAGPQLVPSWMIGLAWDTLRAQGTITNRHLLEVLHVHRSSFVCALLARLPGVRRRPGQGIALEWTSPSRPGPQVRVPTS
jgi:HKD family nuclease